MQRVAIWIGAAAGTLGVAACADPALSGGARSFDALATAYVDAVTQRDTAAMHALRVTYDEHNTLMWPHFPAARPELNWSVEFAWENLDRRSRRDAMRVADQFGGRSWQVLGVVCEKGVTDYEAFRIHGDCRVDLEAPASSSVTRAKLFGSIVEMRERYKIVGILTD